MQLKTTHPLLMVTEVVSFSVVLYWTGRCGKEKPIIRNEALRDAIIAMLPPGTGVGDVSQVTHGQYAEPPRAAEGPNFRSNNP